MRDGGTGWPMARVLDEGLKMPLAAPSLCSPTLDWHSNELSIALELHGCPGTLGEEIWDGSGEVGGGRNQRIHNLNMGSGK